MKHNYLPMTPDEVRDAGWDGVDVVLVTGDAYVDHPSFGAAVIGRTLQKQGYTVAILSQPDWRSCEDFRTFGKPRLFFGITSGNMDSMINKYTALRKVRNDDAYSEGGEPFRRPDRAAIVYGCRAREAFKDVPVVMGGIESSLRRFAHYDYWSDEIRRSVLLDAKADLLVYGMGERQAVEIARRLSGGEDIRAMRDIPGTMYPLAGSGASPPSPGPNVLYLPAFEEVKSDPEMFSLATKLIIEKAAPYGAASTASATAPRLLVQTHGKKAVVQVGPPPPLTTGQMDALYELPYTRKPHPRYVRPIPAFTMIRNSVTAMRGCFGGCSFCAIALHQGRDIQSRSPSSIVREMERIASSKGFDGTITDIGGPTANMYMMGGRDRLRCARCTRPSCLYPAVCPNLNTDHGPLIRLLRRARRVRGVKHVFVSSGIRMDLALRSPEYIEEVARHHTGGRMKVAPEHVSERVLNLMKKPGIEVFERFVRLFEKFSPDKGDRSVVPYIITSHPGTTITEAAELSRYLQKNGYRPREVQDFIPSPMTVSTSMYRTGIDPFSGKRIYVPRGEREKRLFRKLAQYFKPENRHTVARVLAERGRNKRGKKDTP